MNGEIILSFPPQPNQQHKSFIKFSKEMAKMWKEHTLPEEDEHNLYNEVMERKKEFLAEQEKRLEFALRHLIPKPIKGEITPGKLKWRGIYLEKRLDDVHLSNIPRLDDPTDNRTPKIVCIFYYPILCIKPSKSGKRSSYYINLGFEQEPEFMMQYNFYNDMNDTMLFGRSSRNPEGTYRVGGIIDQGTSVTL